MKAVFFELFFLSSVFFIAEAQTHASYNFGSNGVGILRAAINSDDGVGGSTFLFKEWNNLGKLYSDNGKVVDIMNINFNVKDDMFSTKISKDSIFNFYKVYKVEINGRQFKRIENKFYEVLYIFNDKRMFLKEYSVKIEPELHIITSTVIGPGKYVIEDEFYLYKNGNLEKLWLNKRNVLKMLNSEKSLILKQAKNCKLSFSKEKDIVEIFKYYDTL
ncbi:hypothetical protein [Yeosuana marina]|uniref:hypothetical protein n=1 Tax=Yeosuana marina TaxID=1565536 RepID=UPI0030EBD4E1|tara:strand:- start:1260 stop:1910 length:651 start_codon:yes stop_codon:yes gene_type:complete